MSYILTIEHPAAFFHKFLREIVLRKYTLDVKNLVQYFFNHCFFIFHLPTDHLHRQL